MAAEGRLSQVVAAFGEVEFAVGDCVLCTRNNKKLGVVNGDTGIIEGASEKAVVVRLADRSAELPAAYLAAGNLTHGYAMTVHKAQGATCDIALLWGENLCAEAGYTALTRGRARNRTFVLAAEHLPPEPRDPVKYIAQQLSASSRSPAAIGSRGLS